MKKAQNDPMRELFYHPKQNDDLCDSEDNNDDLEQVDVPNTAGAHHNHGKLHHHHHNDNALFKAWGTGEDEEEEEDRMNHNRMETLESPDKVN